MVHNAYDSLHLLPSSPSKIESAASHASTLLLASADGALRIYSNSSSDADPSDATIRREPYLLHKTIPGFSKKAPSSLLVSPSRSLLFSLSDSIAVHRLPAVEPLAVVGKSRGANVFAWDDRRGLLCFGRQKRVGIYRLEGAREFVEVKEFSVPDVLKSMSWCGENICVGLKREYMILNTTNGALSEIFPSGRTAPPLVTPLPSGDLLLGKDNIGIFVDQDGNLLHDDRICWSDAPLSVVFHQPYVLACLPRHVEVRSLGPPFALVQTVALRDVRLLFQSGNCVMAALDYSIYGLVSVPIGAQIIQLTASGNFEEALSLCKFLPPEDSTLRASKEDSIRVRYGHHLFQSHCYEQAMEQFLASSVEITHVLSLFPNLLLPKGSIMPESIDIGSDAHHLSRVPSDASDEMDSSSYSHDSDDKSTSELNSIIHNSHLALIKYLKGKRFPIIEKATAEVTEEVVSDAVTSYDSSRSKSAYKSRGHIQISSRARETAATLDTALLQALLLTGQSEACLDLLKSPNYCDIRICEECLVGKKEYFALIELYKSNRMHREALKLLSKLVEESDTDDAPAEVRQKFCTEMIIDYLKPLCSTDPMLVLEFSMLALEKCPTETFELYMSGNIPADLINSYLKEHAPKMQAKYLELMVTMDECSVSTILQNDLVQIYLSEVLDWYAKLKTENKWDEREYSSTRKKLLVALDGISGYNAEILLQRLPLDALYEERALLLGKMNQHQFALIIYVHKLNDPELAIAYCDRVYKAGQQPTPSKVHTNIYLMLLQIYLNPRKTVKDFERRTNGLALQPSAPGFSKGTVRVKGNRISRKIAEIGGAEDVMISQSGTDSGRSDEDGDELTDDGGPIMLDEAFDLLSRKWNRFNGAQALKLLPQDSKLQKLLPFLERLLKKTGDSCRNYAVIRSMRQSENLQVKDELYKHQRTVVKITSDSLCSLCRKKIGTSAFAVYPNAKTIVHFVCFRDAQSMKAVSTPFKKQYSTCLLGIPCITRVWATYMKIVVLYIRIFETGEYAIIAWVGIPTATAWLPTDVFIKGESIAIS